MKRIKIFLASSIEDLREDRLQVGDFFGQLNEIYLDSGVHFSLIKCENYDNSIALGGKQQQYDREIRESELVFFLFFRKVGDYTKHEFEVAMEAFKDRKKPKIITYFKDVTSVDEAAQEVQAFMQLLDREIGHYYNTYGHVDTLKLGILMQIKLLQLDDARIELKNGEVSLNGQTVVKAENVPLLHGNQTLRELTAERKRLQEELDRCRSVYLEDFTPENKDAVYDASAKLNRVAEKLTEVEQDTMALLTTVVEMTSDGRVLTHRMKEALKYFNQGDYTAVVDILGKDRKNELRRLCQRAEWMKNELQGYVEEGRLLIKAIKAQGLTKDWVEEILNIYRDAAELVEDYDLDKTMLYDYANFLYCHNRFGEAISVAEKLNWYYSNPSIGVTEERKAALYNLLGTLYQDTQHYKKSEESYNKAVEIRSRQAARNPEVYEPYLAGYYKNLGNLFSKIQRCREAEEFYGKAVEVYTRRGTRNPDAFEPKLASLYICLGAFYVKVKRYREAEEVYCKAMEIYTRLADRNPEAYEPDLALICNNLGNLYKNTRRYQQAEKVHSQAMEIYTRLANRNPEAYEPDLARSCDNLGNLYKKIWRDDKAEELHCNAMEIYTRLTARNPEAYETPLAGSYLNMGNLYRYTRRYDEAEVAYGKAFEIYTRLANRNPEAHEPNLALCYCCLGDLFINTRHYRKSEEAYGKAMEIYIRLTDRNPEAYEPNLANCYRSLGDLYRTIRHYEKSEEAYGKAIDIFARLVEKNPEVYEPCLAMCRSDLSNTRGKIQRAEKAVDEFNFF